MEETTSPSETKKNLAYQLANRYLLEGNGKDEIVAKIRAKGIEEPYASEGINAAIGQIKNAYEEKARNQMIYGGLIFVVGLALTIGTYSMAASSETGGTYLIAYGPVIFGLIRFFRGMAAYNKFK